LDRFLKIFALNLGHDTRISLFGDWLSFNLAKNPYIAFSIPFSGLFLKIAIGAIIIALIIIWLISIKKEDYISSSVLTFLLLSAINNYYDRLKYGGVIDYLDVKYFTVFNISDIQICFCFLMLTYILCRRNRYV
jgi:signal peptidase II